VCVENGYEGEAGIYRWDLGTEGGGGEILNWNRIWCWLARKGGR
jgi:hypothetical protein